MCGIIGVVGRTTVSDRLVDALRRLEYRGYDSAGIAVLDAAGALDRRRAEGKLNNLAKLLLTDPIDGPVGIGHTRWATHGAPSERNAHPHATEKVAIVHNGIIENFRDLRAELTAAGHVFATETDTETVVHLLTGYLNDGLDPVAAMLKAMSRLEGAFALGVVFAGRPELLIGARRGSPLAIGYGDGEMYLGSDALAVGPLTRRIAYLEEGDLAVLTPDGATLLNEQGQPVERRIQIAELSGALVGKGDHRHYMEKEIFEQPTVVGETLNQLIYAAERRVILPDLPIDPQKLDRLTIIACGTSYYAGMVGKYWFERLARLPVEIDVASEFRYRDAPLTAQGAGLFISQSGETIDTLAALRHVKAAGLACLSVVNVPSSAMAREAHAFIRTLAGPEIGVASTKAFTTQLAALACLATGFARARGVIDADREAQITHALMEVPARMAEVLTRLSGDALDRIVDEVAQARDVLYLGRGLSYPIALEGALKLKEISYIHAEGYAAGEMKHGPIALIDEHTPVIALAPSDSWFDKTVSNLEEVAARRGRVIAITDRAGAKRLADTAVHIIELPDVDPVAAPLLYALPVQLLAYHVAVAKGTDVDQPRNLAKSVTVE